MKKISTLSRLCFAAAPLLLTALFLAALPCRADHAPKIPKQRENRFLFVVDTSSAMRGYSNAIVQGVVELLNSDMRGEFREGDTIGLWTYNNRLHTEFPMQIWSKADKNTIVETMADFLRERPYGRQAHLERVMPPLNEIIKNSERITIILIFDGTGLIQGTPFDKDINDLQNKYARELRAAHVPFVTVLAARNGAVFDYTINYPGLVAIPHTANPEEPVETTNAPVAAIATPATNAPAKPRQADSIIMSHATNVVSAAAPPPATVAAPVAPPAAAVAPPLAVVPVPAPAPAAAVVTSVQPVKAATTPPPVASVAPAPAPASQPAIAATAPPPQTQPVSTPILAQQNPPPVNETPATHAPPASVATQLPQAAPPVARNTPVANISPAGGPPLVLFVMALSLLTIAVVLVVFLIRRSRNASQPSLITQSIDRPR